MMHGFSHFEKINALGLALGKSNVVLAVLLHPSSAICLFFISFASARQDIVVVAENGSQWKDFVDLRLLKK